MNIEFESNFTVLPRHTNYMYPLIFGGSFFSELDLCAAQCVNRFLHFSKTCDGAVTYKFEGVFLKPCYVGDLIFLTANVDSVGEKSVVVHVNASRERRGVAGQDSVATARFVFITLRNSEDGEVESKPEFLAYGPHEIDLPESSGTEPAGNQ